MILENQKARSSLKYPVMARQIYLQAQLLADKKLELHKPQQQLQVVKKVLSSQKPCQLLFSTKIKIFKNWKRKRDQLKNNWQVLKNKLKRLNKR